MNLRPKDYVIVGLLLFANGRFASEFHVLREFIFYVPTTCFTDNETDKEFVQKYILDRRRCAIWVIIILVHGNNRKRSEINHN